MQAVALGVHDDRGVVSVQMLDTSFLVVFLDHDDDDEVSMKLIMMIVVTDIVVIIVLSVEGSWNTV